MKNLVFCLEEPSAREMLEALLPRLLPGEVNFRFIVFRGKQDLEKQLVRRLRRWQTPDTAFVVLRDQDRADCREVKKRLVELCCRAGRPDTLVRVACRELESFYLGDLEAVEKGLKLNGLAKKQRSRKFRDPDRLEQPSQELARLASWRYQKLAGSRAIAPYLRLEGNRSRSFTVLVSGLRRLAGVREET